MGAPNARHRASRPVVDFHAHINLPEVIAFSRGHVVSIDIPDKSKVSAAVIKAWDARRIAINRKSTDPVWSKNWKLP